MKVRLLGFTEEEVSSLPVSLRKGFLEKTCTTKIYKQNSSGRHKHPKILLKAGTVYMFVCFLHGVCNIRLQFFKPFLTL